MVRVAHYLLVAIAILAGVVPTSAQRIDSLHIFKQLPPGRYTSASANAMAWQLYRSNAACTAVKGDRMATARDAMTSYTPERHSFRDLPHLYRLGMAWSGGRPFTIGVMDDLDVIINFTARTEYRVVGTTDRLRVRALLAKMVVE